MAGAALIAAANIERCNQLAPKAGLCRHIANDNGNRCLSTSGANRQAPGAGVARYHAACIDGYEIRGDAFQIANGGQIANGSF